MIAIASMSDVAGYDRNSDAERHYSEPGVELQHADMTAPPVEYQFYARPAGGIRAVVDRLVSTVMPSVPTGAPPIVAHRDEHRAGQPAYSPIRAAAVYVPVQGANQTGGWWVDPSGAELY